MLKLTGDTMRVNMPRTSKLSLDFCLYFSSKNLIHKLFKKIP
jgi:hypothetical protein